ncbi:MAG: amidohydrolase family protein [Victivallaceae bacterium]|nr:amidohydrolase family protein [Victivallaceae bacterium]
MNKRIIDFHTHLGEWQECHGINTVKDFSQILLVMDICGIAKIVLFVGGTNEEEIQNNNVYQLCKKHPDRIIPFMGINPHYSDDIDERLEKYVNEYQMKGIKLHPDVFRLSVKEKVYEKIFSFADKYRLTVISHTWAGSQFCAPELFGELADTYKHATIILGHAGGVNKKSAIETAKKHNVYLELCTSFTFYGSLENMISEIGDDRILFGSDLPFIDPRTTIGWIKGADITDESKEKIFSKNAETILNIKAKGK